MPSRIKVLTTGYDAQRRLDDKPWPCITRDTPLWNFDVLVFSPKAAVNDDAPSKNHCRGKSISSLLPSQRGQTSTSRSSMQRKLLRKTMMPVKKEVNRALNELGASRDLDGNRRYQTAREELEGYSDLSVKKIPSWVDCSRNCLASNANSALRTWKEKLNKKLVPQKKAIMLEAWRIQMKWLQRLKLFLSRLYKLKQPLRQERPNAEASKDAPR